MEGPMKRRLTRLFAAWKGGSGGRGPAPPPDPSQPIRIDGRGEKLVEVVTSASGHRRVGITRDGAGLYRLRVEAWAPDWDDLGVATWIQSDSEGSFADSLERARELAAECLRAPRA
jgi:hypothetical protein